MTHHTQRLHHWLHRTALFLMAVSLTACAGTGPISTSQSDQLQPTEPLKATMAPSATSLPTATPPDIPAGPFTFSGETRPLLLAHYMPWYQSKKGSGMWGWHWTMNHFSPEQAEDGTWKNFASHYTPLTGLYDSGDQALLDYQVQLMKLSGIDGVIVDWYGMEGFWDYGTINAATNKLFNVIKQAGLKFAICYEDATVRNMVTEGHIQSKDAVAHGKKVMDYLETTWFHDDAYLKVDGKPVLFTFGPQYFKNGSDWQSMFSANNPQPAFVTLDNHGISFQAASYPWPPMWASQGGVLSFDTLKSYLNDFYEKADAYDIQTGGAFPGFHDIYQEAGVSSSYGNLDSVDGKTFRYTLQTALDHNPDMVQLITWNDYGEGTMIEPTVETGYSYLETVQEARRAIGGSDFAFTTKDLRLPLSLYELRQKYATDLSKLDPLAQASAALLDGDLQTAEDLIATLK